MKTEVSLDSGTMDVHEEKQSGVNRSSFNVRSAHKILLPYEDNGLNSKAFIIGAAPEKSNEEGRA